MKYRVNKENYIAIFFAFITLLLASTLIGITSADASGINVSVTTSTVSGTNYTQFNVTENGLAKKDVEIYVDNKLVGLTGINGTYKASGLTSGTHNWEAKYGGGTVGSGKFAFFGYNIVANGTKSPPIKFNYSITSKASRSGVWGYDAGTSDRDKQAFISTDGIASGIYLKCKVREIQANIDYGAAFDSNPSLSISSNGYSAANPTNGESTWTGIVQERTNGVILKTYVYYVGYTLSGGKVDRWVPGDNAQFSIKWSGVIAGSNEINKGESDITIRNNCNPPNSENILSLTVNGVTYTGATRVEGGGVVLWIADNNLHAAYIASPQPWSQNESGTGSVTDKDTDKLIFTSSLVAPNSDTIYSHSITINGTTVKDNDANDQSNISSVIKYSGINTWMQKNELHSSMLYHPPKALIDSISPKIAQIGQEITFNGHGETQDAGNLITAYRWRSHEDGNLSSSNSFTSSSLSPASHVIFFQVADNASLWSPEAIDRLRVNNPPNACISSIKGTGVDSNGYPTLIVGDSMTFNGIGIDTDGSIAGYEWSNNVGVLSTSESFSVSELPIGYHTIYFRVKDNDGAWSKKVSKQFVVRRTPVVYVLGYDWQSFAKGKVSYRPEILDPLAYDDIKGKSNLLIEPRTGDIIQWADRLSFEIDKLKRDTGAKKVDIVTFSTGGLNARWYIDKGYKNDVRKLISVAPPNHGLEVAYLTPVIEPFGPEHGAGSQLMPHSSFLQTLNGHNGCSTTRNRGTDHINPDVQYYVISGTDFLTPEHLDFDGKLFGIIDIHFQYLIFTRRGDSTISTESSRLDGVDLFVMPCGPGRDGHAGFDNRGDVNAKVKEILLEDSIPNQNTVKSSAVSEHSNPTPSQKMESTSYSKEDNKTAFNQIAPIFGTIYPGETKSHTIQIDPANTKVIFNLNSLNESDLALFSPTGKLIDPTDPTVNYTKEDGYIVYEVPNPEIGNWTLKVSASNVPENGSNYTLVVYEETDLFVGAGTDKTQYKPNDPITIYAYAQDNGTPLKGASISAEIKGPIFATEKISLFDDGAHGDGESNDGIYANTYSNSSIQGAYYVNVNAEILKDGLTYNRNACTTVWVESLPDLSVSDSDISFSNSLPKHNDSITITARIHNIGDGDAKDANILFFDGDPSENGTLIDEKTVDVGKGSISDAAVNWNSTYGSHVIHVIISPYNEFLEQNYSNNRAQANISVSDTEPPVANAGPDQIVSLNTPVFFDGSLSKDNVGITDITWDVDNDNNVDLTGMNPVLVDGYNSTGKYTVKMTVNDAAGNGPKSDTMNVTVTSDYDIEKPKAVPGPDQTVNLRKPVFFDASSSSDNFGIVSYEWDTDTEVDSDGDGVKDNDVDLVGQCPCLSNGYYALGKHTVKLTVDDVAGNGPVNGTLYVNVVDTISPSTTLSIYPAIPDGLNDLYVTMPVITLDSKDDVSGSGVSKIEYSFDSMSWVTYSESFTVDTKGTITIYFKSTDKAGNVETVKSKTIMIDTPPVADAGGPYEGSAGVALRLSGSKSYDPDVNHGDSIVSYEWDLDGDGLYDDAIGENVEHVWTEAYSGEIGLRVTNNNGASDTDRKAIIIRDVGPIANFSSNVTQGSAPFSVQFLDLSTNATEWKWDFGDGVNSTTQNPVHTYSASGSYTVALTVSNAAGTDTETKDGYIKVRTPSSINLTSITLDPEDLNGNTTNAPGAWSTNLADVLAQIGVKEDYGAFLNQPFSGGSLGEISIPLKVGDNNFTLLCSNIPGANYSGNEFYGAVLFFNGVATPPQIAVYNSNGGTGNYSVQSAGTQIMGGANGGLFFDKAPGTSAYTAPDGTRVEVVSYIIDSSENTDYVSWGEIGPDGNNDTIAKLILRVTPFSTFLVANFSSNVTSGPAPLSVQFTDLSNNATGWTWDFGDGVNSTEQNPIHTYVEARNYTVSLTVSNANGMSTKSMTINATKPELPVFPGCTKPPKDLNNDGLYEDINGNGRLDFADVVTYFNNMAWITQNGLVAYFDYNKNSRIDFNDVVRLFNMH